MRRGATPLTVAITGASSQTIVSGRGLLCGWSLSGDGIAATIAQIFDGDDASSPPLSGGITIPIAGSSHVPLVWAVEFQRGLFVSSTAGQCNGALWALLVPDYLDDKFLDAVLNLPAQIAQ